MTKHISQKKKATKQETDNDPTYLLDLSPNPTDGSNGSAFETSDFEIRSEHVFDQRRLLEDLARMTD